MTRLRTDYSQGKLVKKYLLEKNPNFKKISDYFLQVTKKETGSPFGFAGYIDPKDGKLVVPTLTTDVWSVCRMKNKTTSFDKFDNLFGWVIKNGKSLLTNAPLSDPRRSGIPNGHINIEKFLGAPAINKGKVVGMLALANKKKPYTEEDLKYLEGMADLYSRIIYNISEIKKLKESEKNFRELVENTRDILYIVNKNGIIEYINKRAEDYGYKREDIVGHVVGELAHPEDRDFAIKAFAKAVKSGKTRNILNYRILKKNGTFFEAAQKSSMIFEKGKPVRLIGAIRDVTEERETHKKLRENRELLDKIFNSSKDAIFVKDLKGNYIKANIACCRVFDSPPDKVIGKNDRFFFGREVAAELQEIEKEVIAGKTIERTYERTVKGKKYIFNTVKIPLKDSDGNVKFILGTARDITGLRKLEHKIVFLKTQEKIKQMTSDLSHDINNTLATISGYADLISEDLPPNPELKAEFRIIRKAIKKATAIIRSFRKKSQAGIKNK